MLQRMNDRVAQFTATGANVILLEEPAAVHAGRSSWIPAMSLMSA